MSCVSSDPYQKKKQNQARCQDIPSVQQPDIPTDQLDHDFAYINNFYLNFACSFFKSEGWLRDAGINGERMYLDFL